MVILDEKSGATAVEMSGLARQSLGSTRWRPGGDSIHLVEGPALMNQLPGFCALDGVAEELARIIRPLNGSSPGGIYPGHMWLDETFTAAALAGGLRQGQKRTAESGQR